MFDQHPELERDLFNRDKQKQGEQQKALEGAIAAFATLKLEPDSAKVDLALSRIVHKHASLGITPDQYAIVHEQHPLRRDRQNTRRCSHSRGRRSLGLGLLVDGGNPHHDGTGSLPACRCRDR